MNYQIKQHQEVPTLIYIISTEREATMCIRSDLSTLKETIKEDIWWEPSEEVFSLPVAYEFDSYEEFRKSNPEAFV